MERKINAIVLSRVNYSDRHDIVNLYSDLFGKISALTLKSKSGKSKNLLKNRPFPLALIEASINFNPGKEIQHLKNVTVVTPWQNIYFHPIKNTISLFISEFLSKIFRENVEDPDAWNFLISSFLRFNQVTHENAILNFHLAFTIGLLKIIGLQPDTYHLSEAPYFDMREGHYTLSRPLHNDVISGRYAPFPALFMRMNFDNMHHFKLSKQERERVLDGIIYYYSLHLPGFDNLRTPPLLKQLL